MTPRVILLMGVAGSGKTTVGQTLATHLGWRFEDADAYHSPASLAKMARGDGLSDADRAPWLARLGDLVQTRIDDGPPTVLACSALKAAYRVQLHTEHPAVRLVWLDAPPEVLRQRLARRQGHVAGPDLLPSQLATLEPPTEALRLDATAPVQTLVAKIESEATG